MESLVSLSNDVYQIELLLQSMRSKIVDLNKVVDEQQAQINALEAHNKLKEECKVEIPMVEIPIVESAARRRRTNTVCAVIPVQPQLSASTIGKAAFKCSLCDKSYAQVSSLYRHQRSVHGGRHSIG